MHELHASLCHGLFCASQSVARCLVALYPRATYAQLSSLLLQAYLKLLAEDPSCLQMNEALLGKLAVAVVGSPSASVADLSSWVDDQCARAGLSPLTQYAGPEDKSAEAVASQVSSVLELFEADEIDALERDVIRDVIELMG